MNGRPIKAGWAVLRCLQGGVPLIYTDEKGVSRKVEFIDGVSVVLRLIGGNQKPEILTNPLDVLVSHPERFSVEGGA